MSLLEFTAKEATVHKAIVVSLDLAGFSTFCNQPDAPSAVPRLTHAFFNLLNKRFASRSGSSWTFFEASALESGGKNLPEPNFAKFTGDGALLFWILEPDADFPQSFCNRLVAGMREFQVELKQAIPSWERAWRVHNLPKAVRVGIATGPVYALRKPHAFTSLTDPVDFVGYCVNLAVRLQSYCHDLGFLVHNLLHPTIQGVVIGEAIGMKGTQREPVAFFQCDLANVTKTEINKKFRPLKQG